MGFRPFYALAALGAALLVPLWLAVWMGWVAAPPHAPGVVWHAHEMLLGFASAVIVGFLFTAGRNWTGLPTPRGAALGALALLWLAARLAAWGPSAGLYALLDMALLPLAAGVLARLLLRGGNRRNLPLPGLLLALAGANAWHHAQALAWVGGAPLAPLHAALALVTLIECVMGGRVVPGFTTARHPALRPQMNARLEALTLAATALGLGLWVLHDAGVLGPQSATWGGTVLALACALQAYRMSRWHIRLALPDPMLWILHAAYAWLVLGLGLLALAQWGWVAASAGVHALAVGALGGLTLGMMARTARGHTGRPIQASALERSAFAAVLLAAVVRVGLPLLWPGAYGWALWLAALLWSFAWGAYAWRFVPWLLRARLDGQDG
ncbi:MAG: NnrS family protein [Rhodoferax sp.]